MILSPDLMKQRLKNLGIRADKFLGQHFLINPDILFTMTGEAEKWLRTDDTIIEVGPGLGVLTDELVHLGKPVVAVEKDPVFARELRKFLGDPANLEVVQGDILRVLDQPDAFADLPSWCVIANIPYAITSPLVRKLLYRDHAPHHLLLLVQKETAERICAPAGRSERGLLSVEVEIAATARIVTTVPPHDFWPAPKVTSAILEVTRRETPLVPNIQQEHLLRVVAAGFSAKRKKIQNSLAGVRGVTTAEAAQWLKQANIDPSRRAETLTLEEWIRLSQVVPS